MAHQHDRRPLARPDGVGRLGRLGVVERCPGEAIRPQQRSPCVDHADAPTEPKPGGDQGIGVRAGAAHHQVERRQDRVEHRLADDGGTAMGNGHGRPLAQRIGLLLRQHPALAVEPGEQVGRASLASGAQGLQRLCRKFRRLGEQLDHSPAAEPQAPQLITLGRVVDGDQHRCVEPQRLTREPRSLLLQASAADQPDGRAVLGDQQSRAGRRYDEPRTLTTVASASARRLIGSRPPPRGSCRARSPRRCYRARSRRGTRAARR